MLSFLERGNIRFRYTTRHARFYKTPILRGLSDYVYGLCDGIFECVDLKTGKSMWRKGRYGHGQIVGAGDVILVQTERTGELGARLV